MLSEYYGRRPIIEESQVFNISSFIRKYLSDLPESSIYRNYDLRVESDVIRLIENIESSVTVNLKREKDGEFEYSEPNNVKLTYTLSNLGRGYIFWFQCNVCDRRVRYLYIPPFSYVLACRVCHRLVYEKQKQGKRFRALDKLFVLEKALKNL